MNHWEKIHLQNIFAISSLKLVLLIHKLNQIQDGDEDETWNKQECVALWDFIGDITDKLWKYFTGNLVALNQEWSIL